MEGVGDESGGRRRLYDGDVESPEEGETGLDTGTEEGGEPGIEQC